MEITHLGTHSSYGQVVEIWDDLSQDHDYRLILVGYMPRRCQAVIDSHILAFSISFFLVLIKINEAW